MEIGRPQSEIEKADFLDITKRRMSPNQVFNEALRIAQKKYFDKLIPYDSHTARIDYEKECFNQAHDSQHSMNVSSGEFVGFNYQKVISEFNFDKYALSNGWKFKQGCIRGRRFDPTAIRTPSFSKVFSNKNEALNEVDGYMYNFISTKTGSGVSMEIKTKYLTKWIELMKKIMKDFISGEGETTDLVDFLE